MACRTCQSTHQESFPAEVNIHFPRSENAKPAVWAFPTLLICLDCGFAETSIEERELRLLAGGLAGRGVSDQKISQVK